MPVYLGNNCPTSRPLLFADLFQTEKNPEKLVERIGKIIHHLPLTEFLKFYFVSEKSVKKLLVEKLLEMDSFTNPDLLWLFKFYVPHPRYADMFQDVIVHSSTNLGLDSTVRVVTNSWSNELVRLEFDETLSCFALNERVHIDIFVSPRWSYEGRSVIDHRISEAAEEAAKDEAAPAEEAAAGEEKPAAEEAVAPEEAAPKDN